MPASPSDKRSEKEYAGQRDMERFWQVVRLKREPFKQRWYVPALILLIVLSIPWYRTGGETGRMVLGLPVWIWVPLLCAVGVSILTSLAALRFWKDDEEE